MLVRVTCAGVLIGTAQFDPPEGLAHASLVPTAGYALVSAVARDLGRLFACTQFWSPHFGDFASAAAARWQAGRLSLEDGMGRELAVNNVVVLDAPGSPDGSLVRVIADFRPDLARVGALLRWLHPGGNGRTRPAA